MATDGQAAEALRAHVTHVLARLLIVAVAAPAIGQVPRAPALSAWEEVVLRVTLLGGITSDGVNLTFGGEVTAEWRHPAFPYLFASGILGYRWLPLDFGELLAGLDRRRRRCRD